MEGNTGEREREHYIETATSCVFVYYNTKYFHVVKPCGITFINMSQQTGAGVWYFSELHKCLPSCIYVSYVMCPKLLLCTRRDKGWFLSLLSFIGLASLNVCGLCTVLF